MKILLVADELADLLALEQMLEGVPAELVRATSGDEALALWREHRFALAILDAQMPGMAGDALAGRLRGDPAGRAVPLIFLSTTYGDEGHRRQGYASGAVDCLAKPVDPATLVPKVRVFVDLARERIDLEVQVQARAQARRAESLGHRLTAVIEATHDGFWSVNADGEITNVNAAYARLVGYSVDEILGRNVADFAIPSSTPDLARRRIRQIAGHDGTLRFETQHRHRDGHAVDLVVSATYLREFDEHVAFLRDRSELRRTEAELLATITERDENRVALAEILDTTTDGVWRIDGEGRILGVNRSYAAMLGYHPHEMRGMHVGDVSLHARGADAAARAMADLARVGHATTVTEHRHRDGHTVPVEVTATYLQGRREVVAFVRDISDRRRREEEERSLREQVLAASKRHAVMFDAATDGVWTVDLQGRMTSANDSCCKLLGRPREELIGASVATTVADEPTPESIATFLQGIAAGEGTARFERVLRHGNGHELTVEMSATYLPEFGEHLVVGRDVTERNRAAAAEAALRGEREIQARRFEAIMRMSIDGFVAIDANGFVVDANEAYATLVGWPLDEILGAYVPQVLSVETLATLTATMSTIKQLGSLRVEAVHRHRSGAHIEVEASAWYSKEDDLVLTFVRDLRERKRHEAEARLAAFHDVMTGLPNRRMLIDRYRRAVAASARKKQHGALMYLDLDHFKVLNDALGHEVGDGFLREVARRLLACVREGDTVARLGGDEFVVLLEDLATDDADAAAQAGVIAERIRASLALEYRVDEHVHHGSSSIGLVLFETPRDDLDTVLARADSAMYEAKRAGRNGIHFFDVALQTLLAERAALDLELRAALAREQFELFYQVQVDAAARAGGAEVLLRWRHPERGLVMPGAFIASAEESGFILQLGTWVLRAACAQLVAWQASPQTRDIWLSVNVSARQFAQAGFVEHVRGILAESGAPSHLLRLELTESTALRNVDRTVETMRTLKQLGVRFSMDDFGTGYSSLTYLRHLPFDELKIDQGFVRGLGQDGVGAAIVRSIMAMSEALGMEVVAEGVETVEERQALAAHGCGRYQGYLFGRPVPLAEFEASLQPDA